MKKNLFFSLFFFMSVQLLYSLPFQVNNEIMQNNLHIMQEESEPLLMSIDQLRISNKGLFFVLEDGTYYPICHLYQNGNSLYGNVAQGKWKWVCGSCGHEHYYYVDSCARCGSNNINNVHEPTS